MTVTRSIKVRLQCWACKKWISTYWEGLFTTCPKCGEFVNKDAKK